MKKKERKKESKLNLKCLAHPNVRLFITNGGSLSIMEAIYYETPIIGIPIYGDQDFNLGHVEKLGFGRIINFHNITEDSLSEAISDVLSNPSYRENVVRISRLFKDNAIDPLQSAIYNIEYILRTNGAKHYRSASVDLSLWQQNLFDVALIITAGILLILAVPSIIICIVLRKSNNASKVMNNNNKLTSPRRTNNKKKQN